MYAPVPLTPGKELRYWFYWGLDSSQRRSGHFEKEKHFCPYLESNHDSSVLYRGSGTINLNSSFTEEALCRFYENQEVNALQGSNEETHSYNLSYWLQINKRITRQINIIIIMWG
jgi:hypothetical protein